MIKNLTDFRGGYATNIPSELMGDTELLKAENCQWRTGVVKRNGISIYDATDFASMVGFKGAIRAFINSTWYTIIAVDDDTNVHFYAGTGTTFTVIDANFHFTKGKDVEMAELQGHVVCVNGTDKPAVIYWNSALVIENLEAHDIRTREELNWFAGQWDNDGVASYFIDDSVDAKSTTGADFQLGNTTNNDGFYISCNFTFNKVTFTGASQAGGAPVAEYMYWNGTAWTTLGTLVTTPAWTDAGADRTLEFNLPLAADGTLLWEPWGADDATTNIEQNFIIRVRFTTAASGAFTCGHLTIQHTQYLTQVLQNARPHLVCSHNAQIYLAERNILNFSPPNQVTGWRENQAEYFVEGGEKITGMVSGQDSLIVFKENTIYTYTTSNLLDPIRSRPLSSVGCVAPRSCKSVGNITAFVARDGIYLWDGTRTSKVSKHIKSDFDSYTLTNACAVSYQNEYWLSFPTNSIVLSFDPDTFRVDDVGDGRVSFWKFTGYKVSQFLNCNGYSDTQYLLGIVDQSAPYLARCDYGTYDFTGTNIDMRVQTKYLSSDNFLTRKQYGLLKVKLKQVALHSGELHRLILYRDDNAHHFEIQLYVTKGTNYYEDEIRIPGELDGNLFSIELRHNKPTLATLMGYSFFMTEGAF